MNQYTPKHVRAGCGACELFELVRTVEGKKIDSGFIGLGNVRLALDRIAERKSIRVDSEAAAAIDLARARQVKIRSERSQRANDLSRWIGLYGIENSRLRELRVKCCPPGSYRIEVDDDERCGHRMMGEKCSDSLAGANVVTNRA